MTKRSYHQYCPMAKALDLVGERWTLLVVRDLLLGPRRYSDLLLGLPGLSTDLLAERLRSLEELGVVRKRRLPAPAASTVYELTPQGEELREVLAALAMWGRRHLPPAGTTDDRVDVRWALLSMGAGYHGPADRRETYQLVLDDEPFTITVDGGGAIARAGRAEAPVLTLTTTAPLFLQLAAGHRSPAEARHHEGYRLDGPAAALDRMVAGCGLTFGQPAAV